MNWLNRYSDHVYSIARLIIGLMFACHGGQKILGFPPGGHGMPTEPLGIVGAWIELACGFMVALGFLTRIGAFIASGEMAVGYFMAHAPQSFFPIVSKGELAVFYCFFFLFVVFHGPGRWSLDAVLFKKGAATAPAAT